MSFAQMTNEAQRRGTRQRMTWAEMEKLNGPRRRLLKEEGEEVAGGGEDAAESKWVDFIQVGKR